MQYDSGYVAYLNGVEVASSNAPASPHLELAGAGVSQQPGAIDHVRGRRSFFVPEFEHDRRLTATGNVLAIQTLMATPTDQSLFVLPEISEISITQAGLHFFNQPSPGTYNTVNTWQPDLTFSVQHGFFSAPFQLTLSTTTSRRYDLLHNRQLHAQRDQRHAYTGPITISATTDVRAVSIIDGNAGVVSTE